MRVAVYYSNSDIRLEEKPKPEIGEGELLVKVEASGICGTDCLEWYRIHRVPLVLGHEIAGTVAEVGKGARGYRVGDRVSASHHVPCGQCRFCRDGHETVCDTLRKTNFDPGGFSEFVRIPKINVDKGTYRIPMDVSFEDATFIEPLACVLRGQRLANLRKGKSVLVIGSGISGLLHIKLARAGGVKRIFATDISDPRLTAAKKFGADHAISAKDYTPEMLRGLNDGYLADFVIICAGAKSAFENGLRSVERGGTVLIFAAAGKDELLPVPTNDIFWRNEVTIMSSYAGSPEDHREALAKIASHKINVYDMITHRFGLGETGKGFKLVSEARDSIKVIIEPQK
ncbi:MAG: zinc-dependent dehydrogenase [Candidatus Omnitrophica bacterium]|nr:zinc-dependent dehydrogenase [Candidatus Omnitrophota bacterium]MDD5436366.1 zinc-dependent dehydrogenase [Candidatus Omnitrophota bacterium]